MSTEGATTCRESGFSHILLRAFSSPSHLGGNASSNMVVSNRKCFLCNSIARGWGWCGNSCRCHNMSCKWPFPFTILDFPGGYSNRKMLAEPSSFSSLLSLLPGIALMTMGGANYTMGEAAVLTLPHYCLCCCF